MRRTESSKLGAQQLRGTITQLKRKLAEAQAELALQRDIVRAARRYLTTGRDQALREAMEATGWEEPPRKPRARPQPSEPELPSEGKSFHPHEGFELL